MDDQTRTFQMTPEEVSELLACSVMGWRQYTPAGYLPLIMQTPAGWCTTYGEFVMTTEDWQPLSGTEKGNEQLNQMAEKYDIRLCFYSFAAYVELGSVISRSIDEFVLSVGRLILQRRLEWGKRIDGYIYPPGTLQASEPFKIHDNYMATTVGDIYLDPAKD